MVTVPRECEELADRVRAQLAAPLTYSPIAVAEAAFDTVRRWREASDECGSSWPHAQCVETALDLVEVLDERVPDAGAAYVWGEFRLTRRRLMPWWTIWRLSDAGVWEPWASHAWVELGDETVVDPTVGQFTGGPPLAIVPPDADRRCRWRAIRRGLE